MTDDNKIDTLYWSDARFYDLDNRPPLKEDIPFYLDFATRMDKGLILELACGTGRITIPLAEAGREIWALEFSQAMIDVLEKKKEKLPKDTADKIHLFQGDMSDFQLGRKFPLILLPARSFQLLLDESKEKKCLESIFTHLTEDGYFILTVANYMKNLGPEWGREEEYFDWENIDPETGRLVRRTHVKKKIDREKQILYPKKIYHIYNNGTEETQIVKQAAWKYFTMEQLKNLLYSSGFKIIEEMGYFDGRLINEGSEFIFICRK
jgi:SAM-dependent methyltransferase